MFFAAHEDSLRIDLDLHLVLLVTSTEAANNAVIEKMKKQIDDILVELNLLKEHQALQTGIVPEKEHHLPTIKNNIQVLSYDY